MASIGSITMTRDAERAIGRMVNESDDLQSEVGGIACYELSGSHAVINDIIPMKMGMLSEDRFPVSTRALKSSSRFFCSNDVPILVHTHPSGESRLSSADISFSKKNDAVICAIAGTGVHCNAGDRGIGIAR
jgi:hypothetical protein